MFLFDGGLALRCTACGWRFYAGPWDDLRHYYDCVLCAGEMAITHEGRDGDWQAVSARPFFSRPSCAVPVCERPSRARGLCDAHYNRWHKTGDVQPDVPLRSYPRRTAA
jgi:hypothetical protein